MTPTHQLTLPLVDPLEPRILPQDGDAWFTLNRINADGRMAQRSYRLELIETVLRAVGRSLDTYMSQGFFAVPCRRAVHLAYMTHGYVDLDTYRSDQWHGLPPDEVAREIVWFCDDEGIPQPSMILSSGRGFYCKWFWSAPVPRSEAGRAMAINRALTRRLVRFRADPNAVDVSRILRVAGTINGKNGRPVGIVSLSGPAGAPTTYDFAAFARAILPEYADKDFPGGTGHPAQATERHGTPWESRTAGKFHREHWHWGVLEDIRRLAAIRYPGGIVQPGRRDLYGHLAACQLARVIMPGPLFHEITTTVRTFLPSGYVDDELRRHCSSLLRRAGQAAEGELVTFRGGQHTPIYTYSKTRLIDLLEVMPDEERGMIRLISDAEKRRRETERRRAAGVMDRAGWLAENSTERERPWEAEGISRMTWYRRRRERP